MKLTHTHTHKCHYCHEPITTPVIREEEISISPSGIEMDVPVTREYCSELCADESIEVASVASAMDLMNDCYERQTL